MRFALLLFLIVFATSCKSSKRVASSSKNENTESSVSGSPKANNIIKYAKQFEGVRYKYGGTTKKGMDCSGLVLTSYKSEQVALPRTTGDLSKTGDWIDLKTVKKGDLLFFATQKNSRKVNHVGIVTRSKKGDVQFIHASTSKGVMISQLKERYWYHAFVQARRVL